LRVDQIQEYELIESTNFANRYLRFIIDEIENTAWFFLKVKYNNS